MWRFVVLAIGILAAGGAGVHAWSVFGWGGEPDVAHVDAARDLQLMADDAEIDRGKGETLHCFSTRAQRRAAHRSPRRCGLVARSAFGALRAGRGAFLLERCSESRRERVRDDDGRPAGLARVCSS